MNAISKGDVPTLQCVLERPSSDTYHADCCHISPINEMDDCCPVTCKHPTISGQYVCVGPNLNGSSIDEICSSMFLEK